MFIRMPKYSEVKLMFVSDVFINTHAHVKTCKMAENKLSVVSDGTLFIELQVGLVEPYL